MTHRLPPIGAPKSRGVEEQGPFGPCAANSQTQVVRGQAPETITYPRVRRSPQGQKVRHGGRCRQRV